MRVEGCRFGRLSYQTLETPRAHCNESPDRRSVIFWTRERVRGPQTLPMLFLFLLFFLLLLLL